MFCLGEGRDGRGPAGIAVGREVARAGIRIDAGPLAQPLVDLGPVDLLETQKRQPARAEALLETRDAVARSDAAAEAEHRDRPLPVMLDGMPEERGRMALALRPRDVEEEVGDVR